MATANEFKFSTRCHTIDSCHTPACCCCCCCCYWQTACENARVRRSLRGEERGDNHKCHSPCTAFTPWKRPVGDVVTQLCLGERVWERCSGTLPTAVATASGGCKSWLRLCELFFLFLCQQFAVIKDICVQHVHPCTIVSACPHVRCVRCRFALMKLHYTKWRDEERCEKQKKSAKLHKNTQEERERVSNEGKEIERKRKAERRGDRQRKKEGKTRRRRQRLRLQLAVCASGMSLLIEREREAGGKRDRESEKEREGDSCQWYSAVAARHIQIELKFHLLNNFICQLAVAPVRIPPTTTSIIFSHWLIADRRRTSIECCNIITKLCDCCRHTHTYTLVYTIYTVQHFLN